MRVLRKSNIRPFDVDNTLIMHDDDISNNRDLVQIVNPYTSVRHTYVKNHHMITLLKEEYARGNPVIVWSRRGWEWAESVVIALLLEDCVSIVMEKPIVYFDDRDVSEWMKDRVYIGPKEKFK